MPNRRDFIRNAAGATATLVAADPRGGQSPGDDVFLDTTMRRSEAEEQRRDGPAPRHHRPRVWSRSRKTRLCGTFG